MQLVDLNVALYAVNAPDPMHQRARRWLDRALNGTEAVGFGWLVLVRFLRIATRPGIFSAPLAIEQAVGTLQTWLDAPVAWSCTRPPDTWMCWLGCSGGRGRGATW